MKPIEQQFVKGLSIKGLITLIACTVTIVGTTIKTYSSLDAKMDRLQLERSTDVQFTEYRLKTLEETIKAIQVQQDLLRNQVNENRRSITGGQ